MKRYITVAVVVLAAAVACGDSGGTLLSNATTRPGTTTASAPAAPAATDLTGATSSGATAPKTSSADASSKLPADVCALLTAADVALVVTDASAGKKTEIDDGTTAVAQCEWTGTTRVTDILTVLVRNIAKLGPAAFRAQLQAVVQKRNGTTIAGLGDYAAGFSNDDRVYQFDVIRGALLLTIELNAPGAATKGDLLAKLGRSAFGRLG